MVDIRDLKSLGPRPCGFESHRPHQRPFVRKANHIHIELLGSTTSFTCYWFFEMILEKPLQILKIRE